MNPSALKLVHHSDGDGIAFLVGRSVISVNRYGTVTKRRHKKSDEFLRCFDNDLYVENLRQFRLGWTYEMGGRFCKLVDNHLFGLKFLAVDKDGESFEVFDHDYDTLNAMCANRQIKMVQAIS